MRCSLTVIKRKDGTSYQVKAEGVVPNVVVDIDVGKNKSQKGKTYPHEAPYPTALAERFCRTFCPPNGLCLDPLNGIASTGVGVAAVGRDISYVGVDCAPRFVAWSQERLEALGYYNSVDVVG